MILIGFFSPPAWLVPRTAVKALSKKYCRVQRFPLSRLAGKPFHLREELERKLRLFFNCKSNLDREATMSQPDASPGNILP